MQDDIIDLTMDDISVNLTPTPPRTSPKASKENSALSESRQLHKGKGKGRATSEKRKDNTVNQGPSDAVIATWRKGDDDLEPSTKMLALINLLKKSDTSDDKTICYSQCG